MSQPQIVLSQKLELDLNILQDAQDLFLTPHWSVKNQFKLELSFKVKLIQRHKLRFMFDYLRFVFCPPQILARVPCQHQERTVVISCQEDSAKCLPAVAADIPILTAEFLLTGLLRQEIDTERYPLLTKCCIHRLQFFHFLLRSGAVLI